MRTSREAPSTGEAYKDLLFSDLVKELSHYSAARIVNSELDLMRRVVTEHLDWLETPSCATASSWSCSAGWRCSTSRPCMGQPGGGPTSPCTRRS
jgi:hypothetical protein